MSSFSYFLIACVTYHYLACPWTSSVINDSSLLSCLALPAKYRNTKGKWKKRWNVSFFCFWNEIQFKTMNHCGHCSLADINWSFFHTQFWTIVLPPSSYRKFAQFQNTRTQGEILLNFIFFTWKMRSTKSQIVPAIEFSRL